MIPYKLFHNVTARFGRAGKVEDRYVRGHVGTLWTRTLTAPEELCEAIFMVHNADDRPDRLVRPSLSVGDVVALGADETLWSVAPVGFALVPPPTRLRHLTVFNHYECSCGHQVTSHAGASCYGDGEQFTEPLCPCPSYDGPWTVAS